MADGGEMEGGQAARGTVRAVSRALAVMRAFRQEQPSLALADIAAAAQLDRATARRMLLTLMEEGLVRQDALTQHYALSAKMIEAAGFDALLTTGFGISASMLGQPDVELYTMTENLNVVRQIVAAVEIPVVADCDTGYGNAVNVMRTVREFEQAGVAAVILEDQVVPKRCPAIANVVEVLPLAEGVAKIRAAVEARRDPDLVIIARTDAPTEAESMERIRAYVEAGADMVQPISKTVKDAAMLKRLKLAAGAPVSLQVLGWLEELTPSELGELSGMATFPLVPLAAAGLSFTHGAELAAAEISAGDIIAPGAKLSLDIKEAGGDPARSIQDMHQFLADRRILATSCCILSAIANSLKPVVAGKIALVIYGATAPGIPALPWVYSVTALPGPKDTETAATVAKALRPKTVAYFVSADNDAFKARMTAAEKAVTETGAKTAAVISVLGTDTDFTAAATQAMGASPDAIMVYTTQTPAAGIVAALRARGYKGTIVGNDVLAPAPIWKKIGAPLAGVPFPLGFSPDVNQSPDAKAFVVAYQKQYGAAPDLYAAQGYEAIWLIAQALHGMDGTPTREALAEALSHQAAIEHNVYGGLQLKDGQAEIVATTIVNWTADGTLAPWKAPQ